MERHSENAFEIAKMLEDNKQQILSVNYPWLASMPSYSLAKRQMKLGGGMLSFRIRGGLQSAKIFLENVKFFALARSLGGVESLIEHPATMTHVRVPKEERERRGIYDDLIRLSVGIEDKEDLVSDINNALGRALR